MIDIEQISRKASHLDETQLQTLSEFLDFLLNKRDGDGGEPPFAASVFEAPDAPSVYHGTPLTLEQMKAAVDWEGGRGV